MGAMPSLNTGVSIVYFVYSTVCSGADQLKHQSSALQAFVLGEFTGDRWISPQKGPVTPEMFPFDDVVMKW